MGDSNPYLRRHCDHGMLTREFRDLSAFWISTQAKYGHVPNAITAHPGTSPLSPGRFANVVMTGPFLSPHPQARKGCYWQGEVIPKSGAIAEARLTTIGAHRTTTPRDTQACDQTCHLNLHQTWSELAQPDLKPAKAISACSRNSSKFPFDAERFAR